MQLIFLAGFAPGLGIICWRYRLPVMYHSFEGQGFWRLYSRRNCRVIKLKVAKKYKKTIDTFPVKN